MDNSEHQTEKQTIYWEGYNEGQKESKVEIERLRNTLDIVRENIYDRGWINLESFDEIVQALKEEGDGIRE